MIAFVLKKKKNLAFLFGVGFVIGILLEIALIESGRDLMYSVLRSTGAAVHEPKIACVVLVKNLENLAAARGTWTGKCDELLAVRIGRNGTARRTEPDGDDPRRLNLFARGRDGEVCERTGVVNVTANSAWSGLCSVLLQLRSSPCDWFIIAPDNLLVLVENLKAFVREFDSGEEHYFGHAIGHFEADYNALSAGVLISRGTLSRLVRKFGSLTDCDASGKYWRNEDLYLGKYLKELGIVPRDTRDGKGRGRFHGYSINVLLSPGKLFQQSDYSRKALYPSPAGLNCCSPQLITIDATNSHRMYHHFYYIYELSKTGKSTKASQYEKKDGFDWREFLRGEGYNDTAIENMSSDEYYQIWAKKIPPETLYEMMRKEFGS